MLHARHDETMGNILKNRRKGCRVKETESA
jgi:hypothetical protein